MRRGSRLIRMLVAAGAAVAAAVFVAVPPGWAAQAKVSGRAVATPPFGIKQVSSKTELLINGDRLTVSGGRVSVEMAGSGLAAAVTEMRLDGRLYAIPDAALAFLGRGLDPSLFDATALPAGGTLPVQITYTARVPRLPGITITRAAGGVAAGYLTAASAPAFGAALVRQLSADHDRGSYGTDGLFGGGVTVSLAGAPAFLSRPKPQPRFPMHELTMRGVTMAGKPDTGDMVYVMNSDNLSYFSDPFETGNFFYHGTAKYSVPAGHYWAIAVFITLGGPRVAASVRIVVLPHFTVTRNTLVTLRARSASQPVRFITPKPATLRDVALVLADHIPPLSNDFFAWIALGGLAFWVSPTSQRLTSGSLREFVIARLVVNAQGPPRPDTGPTAYYLAFQGPDGFIASQRFVAGGLATVHASYSSDVPTTGGLALWGVPAGLLQDGLALGFTYPVAAPLQQTEYLSAGPDVDWFDQYYQSLALLTGGQTDVTRTYVAGTSTSAGWNNYPLHTALNSGLTGVNYPFGASLSATRDDNALTLDVTPFSDGTTGHTGSGFSQGLFGSAGPISGSYRITVNGKGVASGNAVQGRPDFSAQVNLPGRPSAVTFTLNASRTGSLYPLSTATSTTWAWKSANDQGINLPPNWLCADGSPSCVVEPLVTVGYDVAGIGVDGTAPAGAQVVRLTIGHQQFAATPGITSASASVSFDDGATWQPATVTGTGGTRYAVFGAPAGRYVSLKVTAGDAAGGTVTETLTRAYATATGPDLAPGAPGAPGATRAAGAAGAAGWRAACPAVGPVDARCFVLYSRRNAAAVARAAGFGAVSAPAGWGATDIERAYKLPVGRNPRQTVAVVDAYDTPHLESYLNTYRRQYHLPPCTTANGCFREVNEAGQAAPLARDGTGSGWDAETTLDVDMVSAACPRCHILVVEANGQTVTDLAAAENTAVRLGAAAVSNSYGVRENGFALALARAYDHPGHAIVASSGDYGYTAAAFPADLTTVTAVGGTELSRARNGRGWLETVWNEFGVGAGSSGCSAYVGKPRWQHDPHCPGRTVADVSAIAWEVAIYEKTYGGWVEVAGTSISAPLVAGIYALAGNAARIKPGYEYAHARSLFDVSRGDNDYFGFGGGSSCGYDYLCVAKKGYDAPTGLGTPDGTGAF